MASSKLFMELMKDYRGELDHSGVSGERLARRLHALSEIGFTEEGGSFRPGFSAEEKQAKELVKSWMKEAGLSATEDGAGNVIGRLTGKNNDAKAIASGSHVDSVPNGGHFDGPLGVLAALEVAEAWRETGYVPDRPYEVLVFTDEEGTRFNSGLSGSMGMTGEIDYEATAKLTDFNGESFEHVLKAYGSDMEQYKAAKRELAADLTLFIEVHIEQGKKLEQAGQPVGIVSGIAGPAWLEVTFTGEAGHAGNTPMTGRKDPLVAAALFIQQVASLPEQISDTAVATVGKLHVSPNGTNVIPQRVVLTVDLRDIHTETRDKLLNRVIGEAERIAEDREMAVEIREMTRIQPIPIAQELQNSLAETLQAFDIDPVYVPSGAGHDAMILGRQIPVAMLFARSKDGISHNPKEWTSLNDCLHAVHALKQFIEQTLEKQR